MRTLLVLRHAKSSWRQAGLADHDRPLAERGHRDAPRMGRLLRWKRLLPGTILTSSAKRARLTAEAVAAWSAFEGEVTVEPRLYLADVATIIDIVCHAETDVRRVLLVGHNPGLEQLVGELTGEVERLPTAALAQLDLPIEHWRELDRSTRARLVRVWRPRALDIP